MTVSPGSGDWLLDLLKQIGNSVRNLFQAQPFRVQQDNSEGAQAARNAFSLGGVIPPTPTPTGAPKVNPMLVPSTWRPPAPPRPPIAPPRLSSPYGPTQRKPVALGANVGSRVSNPRPTYRPRSGGY